MYMYMYMYTALIPDKIQVIFSPMLAVIKCVSSVYSLENVEFERQFQIKQTRIAIIKKLVLCNV